MFQLSRRRSRHIPAVTSRGAQSHPNWLGLPKSGSVSLAGNEVHNLTTTAAVPDTAASGYRWLRLTVTRPNGLPDASADGGFLIQP